MSLCNLLYVEDEELIRESYARMLRHHHYHVVTATDAAQGWERYRQERPAIMIVDIVMPGDDGLSLIEKIRQHDLFTRILLLTAHKDTRYLMKVAELGITRYLLKPVKKEALLNALELAKEQIDRLKLNPLRYLPPNTLDRSKAFYEKLTKSETMLLNILAMDKTRHYTIEEIENLFYMEYDKDISAEGIKALIKRLRKKLPEDAILNRFGHGYRFTL